MAVVQKVPNSIIATATAVGNKVNSEVMSFKKWLGSWFKDDLILGIQTRSDVEVAMKHMGVSYK